MNHKQKFNSNRRIVVICILAIMLLFSSLAVLTLVLPPVKADEEFPPYLWTTDVNETPCYDFPPNSLVYLHGAGFQASTNIDITITRPNNETQFFNITSNATGFFLYVYDLNGIEGDYLVEATDGLQNASMIFYDGYNPGCHDPDCECEDELGLPTGVKFEFPSTSPTPDSSDATGISIHWHYGGFGVSWSSSTYYINEIITKEGRFRYTHEGGYSGFIPKSGRFSISHITFCRQDVIIDPCLEHVPPTIDLSVVGPQIIPDQIDHPNPCDVNYFIQTSTEIDASVTDGDDDSFEVSYKTWAEGETEPNDWIPWFTSEEPTHDPITFLEECMHFMTIKASDPCDDSYLHLIVIVDETDPVQTVAFGNPKNTTNNILVGIGPNTPVWLNSSDFEDGDCCGIGSKNLSYKLFLNNTQVGPPVTIEDQSEFDVDERFGYVSVRLDDWENCLHQIHWACKDYFGNGNTLAEYVGDYDHKDFWVDAKAPVSDTEYSQPHFLENYGLIYTWVNCDGVKYINVSDTGCTHPYVYPTAIAGVEKVEWTVGVDEDIDGTVDFSYSGTVFDNDVNDNDDTPGVINMTISFSEDCLHIVQHTVYDKFGNWAYMPKQHVKVDCTPPEITKYVNGTLCVKDQDNYDHDVWCVTMDTFINFSATDFGCFWQAAPSHPGIGLDALYYRVWDEINGWSDPVYFPISNNYAEGSYQFTDECKHYFEIVAIDKLGNMYIDNETFYVDETPPDVFITVVDPPCESDDEYDYCINFSTLIKLEAMEQGCCNELIYVLYNVTNDDTGQYSGWQPISWNNDQYALLNYYIQENCNHTIELKAADCLGNENYTSLKVHVDEQEPGVEISVGTPNCETDVGYCVNFSTIITLDAWERGCCNQLTNVSYRIKDQYETSAWMNIPINPVTQTATLDYQFTVECTHVLELYAEDCLGNNNFTSMKFYVDESEPTIEVDFVGPECIPEDVFDLCITTDTLISINIEEQGCCDLLVNASYRIGNDAGWGPWIPLDMIGDDSAVISFYIKEECNHTLEIKTWDCLNNMNTTSYKIHVDDQEPGVAIIVNDPNCGPFGSNIYCVNFSTTITLKAWERGCCNQLINVSYRVKNESGWSAWKAIAINEIHQNATLDYLFTEECRHEIELSAEDCLGNTNETIMKFNVDESKPDIRVSIEGTQCIPDDGYDYCITTGTKIIINIYEQGCCDELANASIRIKNDSGWGHWIPFMMSNHYAGIDFNIDEECNHTLEIQTWDCLNNYNSTSIKFHVDDQEPGVEIITGDPNCGEPGYYCVNLSTVITLNAWERGCCNELINVSYRVFYEMAGWGPWKNIPINPVTQTATLDYMFQEECNHEIELYAEDCLGHTNSTLVIFAVDETEPSIDVDIGKTNCEADDDYDYCIRTDTPIYINIEEQGCCDILTNASYRIMNATGWGPWINIPFEGDSHAMTTIFIDEECNHTLKIATWDCIGNFNYTYIKFHVDDQAPFINKTVGEPKLPYQQDIRAYDYWITCETDITIDVYEQGCCDQLVNVSYRINETEWIDITQDMIDGIPTVLNFDDTDCVHKLEIYAEDCLENVAMDKEFFYVDCTPPESYKTFCGPYVSEDLNQNGTIDNDIEKYFWIQDHGTQIFIQGSENNTDNYCDVGIDFLYVELWWDQDVNGTIEDDELRWGRLIYDNDDNDSDSRIGFITYHFNITEDCYHEIRWKSVDKLGNREPMHNQPHRVDSKGPETVKTIGDPKWWDDDLNLWWVTSETNFNLKAVDMLEPCAVGTDYLIVTRYHSCDNMSWSLYDSLRIDDNEPGDLNDTIGVIEFNFTLPYECYWQLSWQAVDKLTNEETMHYQYHIVDNTPPHVIILKPTDGWYAPGSVIPSVVVAEDLMSPHSECCMGSDCAVGIQHGSPGKAWLIDIFPEFKIIELETENFLYDAASHEYIGNVKIPIDANITDGSCLFVVGSEDRLGNNWTSIHELVHAYIIQALAECGPYENCVMGFLADVLVDFIADRNIVFVGIDGTPPEVEFDESESTGAPIPDVLYPGVLEIKANITDTLTGIKSGSTCYIYLNGIMLEQLPYDQFTETCHGWIGIPNYYPNMEDVPLTIEAYDDVGNKGSDTVIVDYVNTMSNVIPIIRFESPDWNTTHSGILSIEVSAHDDTTPTEDLIVKIKVDREDDPPFIYFASYNSGTGTFFCHLDISEYQNGTKLVVQAFAVDKDGYSGDTEPRQFWVESNIIYDQWMHYGWNLVNIVELCGDGIQDIADVLDCLGDNYDWVFEVGSWDNWYRYRTIQSLTTIEEGKWYWINITTWQGIRFYLEDCIIEEPPIPENHAPIANDDTYQTEFDVTFDSKDAFFGVLKNDTDPDGDAMTVQLVSDVMYGTLTLSVNGSFIYVPGPDFYGDSFTYQVYDEHGLAGNIATVTINMCIECIDQGEPS